MTMQYKKIAAALLAVSAMTPVAQAQEEQDVLIMRRSVAAPKGASSPAGPTSSIYNKTPLIAQIISVNGTPPISLNISTESDVVCLTADNQPAPEGSCNSLPTPPSIGQFTIPAQSSSFLRIITIAQSDILGRSPSITNIEQICSSSLNIAGDIWRVACEALPANRYLHLPGDPQPVPQSGVIPTALNFNTTLGNVRCFDQQTETQVDIALCNQATGVTGYGVVTVPVRTTSETRTMVFDPNDLRAKIPTITQFQLDAACLASVTVGGLSWRIRCDEESLQVLHRKEATIVTPQIISLPYPTSGRPNFQGTLNLIGAGVRCVEIATGQLASDSTACDYMANPTGVGSFSLPALYSPSFRTAIIDRDAVLALVPAAAGSLDSTLCNYSGGAYVLGGSNEMWAIRCDMNVISAPNIRIATQASRDSLNTGAPINTGKSNVSSTMSLTITQEICRNTATGETLTDATPCAGLPALPKIMVPIIVSPSYRMAIINADDILAQAPELKNISGLCSGTSALSGTDIPWTAFNIRCDPEEIRDHYMKSPSVIVPAHYKLGPNLDGLPNETVEWNFDTTSSPLCIDTDTDQLAAISSKCTYLSNPANIASNNKITGTFSPTYRRLYVPASELSRLAPRANITNECKRTFVGGDYRSWSVTCNSEDVRIHHRKEITQVTVANANTATLRYGPLKLIINQSKCRDTDAGGGFVADTVCQYLPSTTIPDSISVTRSDQAIKTLWVSRNQVQSIVPTADMNLFCTSRTIDIQQYVYWDVRCDP